MRFTRLSRWPPDDMVQGSDFYSLRFGITLPVWGRQSAEAREALTAYRSMTGKI